MIHPLILAPNRPLLLEFKSLIIRVRWIDIAVLQSKSPILHDFEREREFATRRRATCFARALVQRGHCLGNYAELDIITRKRRMSWGQNVEEIAESIETYDVTPSGSTGAWYQSGKINTQGNVLKKGNKVVFDFETAAPNWGYTS